MNLRHVFLLVVLLLTLPLSERASGAETGVQTKRAGPVIEGPLFISVVFPIIDLKDEGVEMIPSIPDAYNFWGKTIISISREKFYFPASFSYPYRFTKAGLLALQTQLRKIPEVDSVSVKEKSFPNIPTEQLYLYEPWELKQILIKESFVSFRLKAWNQIEIMAFPTFVVMAFDYTSSKIASTEAYEEIKRTFRKAIDEFQTMEHLRTVLGISRKTQRWANVPILTFVAIDFYERNVIPKIFYSGPITPEESKKVFLNQVSLRDYSKGIENADVIDTHCNGISLESSPSLSLWRFYYSGIPLFHDGPFGNVMYVSHVLGPRGALLRILRSALFINVTLPNVVRLSENIEREINETIENVRQTRIAVSREFSEKIEALSAPIAKATAKLEGRIEPATERITEAQVGYEQLIKGINPNESKDICLRLFDFSGVRRTGSGRTNDQENAKLYFDELNRNLSAI